MNFDEYAWQHENHIIKQTVIRMIANEIRKNKDVYGSFYRKPKQAIINKCLIVDYREFIDILNEERYLFDKISRHVWIDLNKINSIEIR